MGQKQTAKTRFAKLAPVDVQATGTGRECIGFSKNFNRVSYSLAAGDCDV